MGRVIEAPLAGLEARVGAWSTVPAGAVSGQETLVVALASSTSQVSVAERAAAPRVAWRPIEPAGGTVDGLPLVMLNEPAPGPLRTQPLTVPEPIVPVLPSAMDCVTLAPGAPPPKAIVEPEAGVKVTTTSGDGPAVTVIVPAFSVCGPALGILAAFV